MQANAGISKGNIDANKPITLREAQMNRALDSQVRTFFDSPTLKHITYDNLPNTPTIQSDKYKDIEIQTFLFEPNFPARIGTLIDDGEYLYLAIQKNGDKIYPELVGRLCNDSFEVPMGYEDVISYNRFGDEIVTRNPILVDVPAVVSDKDYSTASNALIPLPSGRINIEIPFEAAYLEYFKINFRFDHSAGSYQVTDIREERITPDEKFIKISAQRVQSDSEVSVNE